MTLLVIVATVALMIFFNALYVAAEFATVSSRRTRVSQMAGDGNRLAKTLLPIMEDKKALDRYVAACQLGITLSSLVLGAYGQNVIAQLLVEPIAELLEQFPAVVNFFGGNAGTASLVLARSVAVTAVLVGITTLQVIMGELFPKSIAIQYPEQVALAVVGPVKLSERIFTPLIWLFNGSGALLLRLLGYKVDGNPPHLHSPEEIELLVSESHEGGLLEDQERQMLRNALRMRDLAARQVMLHRTRLTAAPEDSSVADVLDLALQEGYSRIPIFRETIDDIIGFVHVKDLFRLYVQEREDLKSIMREVVYVPETMPVFDIWQMLNTRRKYLAIVFDEFGGTAGLITFEDLIEEIFGELQDEFDDEMALVARDKEGRVYLRGDLLVSDVNEYLELELPTEADSLSGLVYSVLGRPPQEGEEVDVGSTTIRVEMMADLGVQEVSLQLPPTDRPTPFSEWEVAEHE